MGSEFKDRGQRAICYRARDEYFECFDKLAKDTDGKSSCKELYERFEKTCGPKWTEHFIRRRDYLKFKEKLEKDGVESVDDERLKARKK